MQSSQPNGIDPNQPTNSLTRSKVLTPDQQKHFKTNLTRLPISGGAVLYSIASKDSNSGLFSNDRLLILNTAERAFGYISKPPQGMIPLASEEEARTMKPKAVLTREGVRQGAIVDLKCNRVLGRKSTFELVCKLNGEEVRWVFEVGNSGVMHEWVDSIKQHLLHDPLPPPPPEPQPQPQYQSRFGQYDNLQSQPSPPLHSGVVPVESMMVGSEAGSKERQQGLEGSKIAKLNIHNTSNDLQYLNSVNTGRQPETQFQGPQNAYEIEKPAVLQPTESNFIREEPPYESRPIQFQNEVHRVQRNSRLDTPDDFNSRSHLNKNKSGNTRVQPLEPESDLPQPLQSPSFKEPQINVIPSGGPSNVALSLSNPLSNSKIHFDPHISRMQSQKHPQKEQSIVIDGSPSNYGVTKNSSSNLAAHPVPNSRNLTKGRSLDNFRAGSFNRRRWNQIFAETSTRLEVYQDFVATSFNLVRDIINELPLESDQREYIPLETKWPYHTYYDQGVLITLHMFDRDSPCLPTGSLNGAPLLYNMGSYEVIKREFYNYNLLLGVTGNEGFIKVPLCAYFQYKGLLALCKAEIPQNFTSITPKRFQKQFDIIQDQIHTRFIYSSFDAYLHPQNKYLIVDNLAQLIPKIPLPLNIDNFFRKQFLLEYHQAIEDQQTCHEAHQHIVQQIVPELLNKMQGLETYAACSTDLSKVLHQSGVSMAYLPLLVQQTSSPYLRKLFATELASCIVVHIFRSELSRLFACFPTDQLQGVGRQAANEIILESCHTLLEMVFGYSNGAESIWRVVVEQCSQRHKFTVSKEDLIPGYLLSAIIEKVGINCDFRRNVFNKNNVRFFVRSENIPKDMLTGFSIRTRRYDLPPISALVRDVESILYSEPSPDTFRQIVDMLSLRDNSIPGYLENLESVILTFLCNFVPYSEHQEFQHIGIYNMVVLQPPSYYGVKLSLLAVKWCIKKGLIQEAFKIYQIKQEELSFWLGQQNPPVTEFHDSFCMYHTSLGQFDEAIQLARLSLTYTGKVVGAQQLPVADKHYQMGNIYFKMGRKEEALKQYSRTKDILTSHNQTRIAQYATILLKISLLSLNFGKITECVSHSLEAIQIFEEVQGSQQDQISTFQLLSRCYEITKKHNEHLKLAQLVAEKFNNTENPSIFARMAKIALYINLKQLSAAESKALLSMMTKLQGLASDLGETEVFTFLHRHSEDDIVMRQAIQFLDNVVALNEEANRKDLFRRFRSLDVRSGHEGEKMLVMFEALGQLVGFAYLIGCLKEYQM